MINQLWFEQRERLEMYYINYARSTHLAPTLRKTKPGTSHTPCDGIRRHVDSNYKLKPAMATSETRIDS